MENPIPPQHNINEFQLIFNECLTEVENQYENVQFDVKMVSQFLINSWLSAIFRLKGNKETYSKEGFKDFILQQLLN